MQKIRNSIKALSVRLQQVLAHDRFFYGVVGLLVLQAVWIALTGRYPMAYDEQNHLGIIRLYADHVLPLWSSQPPGDAPFSAVSRDPSYLYHWLMSLPYHAIQPFLKTDVSQVLFYRFVSIGLFAAGLVLYRKLLLKTKASKALVHSVLAMFVLVPTVPFLAGQMNYDNLLFLLVAILLLLTIAIIRDIKAGRLDVRRIILFTSLSLLTALVKFPFLAILLPTSIWIIVVYVRHHGRNRRALLHGLQPLKKSFKSLGTAMKVMLVVLAIISAGLFLERYGLNALRYGTPVPECDQVLDINRCQAFGPWRRNYDIYQAKIEGRLEPAKTDVYNFTYHEWLSLITWQFFYSLNGPADGFSIGLPTPLPYRVSMVLIVVGGMLVLLYRQAVFRRPYMKGLAFVALFYVFVLWAQNYSDFLRLHVATAIQARYIVLVLPIMFLALGLAYSQLLARLAYLKSLFIAGLIILFITQGGGVGAYIVRSNPTWWHENALVIRAGEAAQRWFKPIVIGE